MKLSCDYKKHSFSGRWPDFFVNPEARFFFAALIFLESRYKIDSSCIIQFNSSIFFYLSIKVSIIMKKIYDQFLILKDPHLIAMHIILEEMNDDWTTNILFTILIHYYFLSSHNYLAVIIYRWNWNCKIFILLNGAERSLTRKLPLQKNFHDFFTRLEHSSSPITGIVLLRAWGSRARH